MTQNELEKILKKLLIRISRIRSNMTILESLIDAFSLESPYNEIYNQSLYFWELTIQNFKKSILIEVAKLYDENRDCLGIKKIINICEQNQSLFPSEHQRNVYVHNTKQSEIRIVPVNIRQDIIVANENYNSIATTRTKLYNLRDRDLAHSDKKNFLTLDQYYQDNSLEFGDIKRMIDVAADICNSFLIALTDWAVSTHHSEIDVDDYKLLLDYAQIGIRVSQNESTINI